MTEEKLQEYPTLIDPFLDFEVTRQHYRPASCNYAISETRLDSGETIVCLHQQREGDKGIFTPNGLSRVCEQGIVICGYKVKPKGIFSFLRNSKIRTIDSAADRQRVESELLQKIEDKKPAYVNFW